MCFYNLPWLCCQTSVLAVITVILTLGENVIQCRRLYYLMSRVNALKIFGVTISYILSVSDHVSNVISSSAQTVHALRLLRAHGINDSSLHFVYQAVIVAKLTYAASVWWGFANASDRSRPESILHWGKHSADVLAIAALVDRADDKLFASILHNPHHVLNNLMPDETVCSYELRHSRHNRELINKTSRLRDSDFIIRMIYNDMH